MILLFLLCFAPFFIVQGHELNPVIGGNVTLDLPFVDCYFVLAASVDSLDEAKAACRSKGGARVAVFRSASEYHAVLSKIDWDGIPGFQGTDKWVGQLWTGLQRDATTKSFSWIDGSKIDMDNYKDALLPDENTFAKGSLLDCVVSRSRGLVATSCQTQKTAGILCQTTTYDRTITVTYPYAIDDTNFCRVLLLPSPEMAKTVVSIPGYVRKTFFTIEGFFTWGEALQACENATDSDEPTSLAVVSSLTEYQLLRYQRNLLTFASDGYWVGLRRHPDGLKSGLDEDGIAAAFMWLDGTPLSYFSFVPVRPGKNIGTEKCVALEKDHHSGTIGFNDYRCLMPDENGEILDWDDDYDDSFGELCEYGVQWL